MMGVHCDEDSRILIIREREAESEKIHKTQVQIPNAAEID